MAKSDDPKKINEAFQKMEVPLDDPDFLIPAFSPAISWGAGGRPKHADWMTYQWKDENSWIIIYPKELRTGTPIFD
jgi:hypothetical protein